MKNKTKTIVETEAVEICPFCEGENIYPNWDVTTQGYVAVCQHCGEQIMLCDECRHAEDNREGRCDWHEIVGENHLEGHCFRGITKHNFHNSKGREV